VVAPRHCWQHRHHRRSPAVCLQTQGGGAVDTPYLH
jgi:hypothetical protein